MNDQSVKWYESPGYLAWKAKQPKVVEEPEDETDYEVIASERMAESEYSCVLY